MVRPWRRRVDRFLLGSSWGAQVSSAIVLVATAYAFSLLTYEQFDLPTHGFEPSGRTGTKAVGWVLTLAVFYGVFLEDRKRLSEVWEVASADAGAGSRIDVRQGANLLCVGLLGEALVGFADLLRPEGATLRTVAAAWSTSFSTSVAYVVLSFAFLFAIGGICIRHIQCHDRGEPMPKAGAVPPAAPGPSPGSGSPARAGRRRKRRR